jgi:hypothetical protein
VWRLRRSLDRCITVGGWELAVYVILEH